MRQGYWLERLDDVHETEDMLMHVDLDNPGPGLGGNK